MEKTTNKQIKYNLELLNYILERDNAKLDTNNLEKITRQTTIYFICQCNIQFNKKFIYAYKKGGAFCKDCTYKNRKKKTINTCIQKYGVENPLQNKDIKNKQENTCIRKYGKINPLLCAEIQEKRKNTMIQNYGVDNPSNSKEIQEKRKSIFVEKYGVDNPLKNKVIKEKQNITIIEKYGVENISQNQHIQEKIQYNSRKFKEFKMPSGQIRKIQGFEHLALNELLQNYDETLIKTDRKDVPRIKYKYDDTVKYYFPDIFIPHENKLIEVKSEYTLNSNIKLNYSKRDACIEQGYKYEFWIYNNKGMNKRVE